MNLKKIKDAALNSEQKKVARELFEEKKIVSGDKKVVSTKDYIAIKNQLGANSDALAEEYVKWTTGDTSEGEDSEGIKLSYANQEGSYDATFIKVEGGYECTDNNYYHLIDTPFDTTPNYYSPEIGDVITDEQFEELQSFVNNSSGDQPQEWWDSLDEDDQSEYAEEAGYDIEDITSEQISELYDEHGIF